MTLEERGKTKLDELIEKADELLTVLNYVVKDLGNMVNELKAARAAQTRQPAEREVGMESIVSGFPEDLRKLLSFEDKGDFIMIKPIGFLGQENFARIADIVRNRLGGEYMSAGKDRHFRVPKKQQVAEA